MATTIPIKSISAAKPPDIRAASASYLEALLRLPAPDRTAELMRIADLANVRLRRDPSDRG